jgi:DNA-binding transcriptional LysR family regulator
LSKVNTNYYFFMTTKKPSSSSLTAVDFDLRQLEVFQKVVEFESFSKAAKAVYRAQASVSETIASLENQIGTRLIDRLGRQIVPTRAGELLYKHAVLLLDMKKTACLEMQKYLGLKGGEIKVGGSTIPGEYILPKVIGRFRKENPSVVVLLTVADSSEIERQVLEGDFELGVIGSKGSHKNIQSQKVWKDELVVAVSTQHRWAKRGSVTVEALLNEPFILREFGSGTLNIMDQYLREAGLKDMDAFKVVARLGTSTAVKEGIKAGLGISILSLRALESELKTGELKALRLKGISMFRNFYLIRDRRRIASPLCKAMTDFLLATSGDE